MARELKDELKVEVARLADELTGVRDMQRSAVQRLTNDASLQYTAMRLGRW